MKYNFFLTGCISSYYCPSNALLELGKHNKKKANNLTSNLFFFFLNSIRTPFVDPELINTA